MASSPRPSSRSPHQPIRARTGTHRPLARCQHDVSTDRVTFSPAPTLYECKERFATVGGRFAVPARTGHPSRSARGMGGVAPHAPSPFPFLVAALPRPATLCVRSFPPEHAALSRTVRPRPGHHSEDSPRRCPPRPAPRYPRARGRSIRATVTKLTPQPAAAMAHRTPPCPML